MPGRLFGSHRHGFASLSPVHASFSCLLLPADWVLIGFGSFFIFMVFVVVVFSICIWVSLLYNLGYIETNPVNMRKNMPSAIRLGNFLYSCKTIFYMNSILASLFTCVYLVWSGSSACGSRVMMLPIGCLGLVAGTTAFVLYPHPKTVLSLS